MFGIGTFRQRLYVQQETPVADTGGGNALTWTTVNVVWGSVEPIYGHEFVQAGKLASNITHRIRIRYDSTITAAMRLMMGTRVFNIRAVRNIAEHNNTIEIFAEEGVAT